MDLSRSTYYVAPSRTDDTALVATMIAIFDEFEASAIVGLAPSCAIAA
jgi:hypothetical protein